MFYVSNSERQPHSFQAVITCEMYLNLELQPRFSKGYKWKCFSELVFFCANSNFFSPADFLLELKYSMTTWQEPGKTNQSWTNSKVFPKDVWGLKSPLLNFGVFCGPFLSILSIVFFFLFRNSNLPVFGKLLLFSVARTYFPEVLRNFFEWFIFIVFF